MANNKTKYYGKVPLINGYEDDFYWVELRAETLTEAVKRCEANGCITEVGIRQGSEIKGISGNKVLSGD